MTNQNQEKLNNLRHSCAHLLAAAVDHLYPKAKRTIGPAIENGFYYDFDFENALPPDKQAISEADFPKIEEEMKKILKTWNKFEKEEVSPDEAKKRFENNPYKLELIEEITATANHKQLTIYRSGSFEDLCKGGHVTTPNEEIGAFKLISVAGAYWKGSEKNKMLTRIYGTAFANEEDLKDYLTLLEEAKLRDHKKIAKDQELFFMSETSPGMAYWLPKGQIVYNELLNFSKKTQETFDYLEIATPVLNKKNLYETSGHWQHYRDDMFISPMSFIREESKSVLEGSEVFGIKPMNCPNAMTVFSSTTRSYKDLPLRYSEYTVLHRFELSGTLNGLFRAREFRQDDAHIFISKEQLENEFTNLLALIKVLYGAFNLEYSLRYGTRPEKFMGDPRDWDEAEKSLEEVLKKSNQNYQKEEGEGAFYGPKVDILMKDSLGREWQTGTIQLDFQQPKNFNLKFIDNEGKEQTPAVIHRAIYGSFERFLAILIEHFAGKLPLWLSPVQVKVLPISDTFMSYAKNIKEELLQENIRCQIDQRNETLQAKIRDATIERVPYLLIVGAKEEQNKTVTPRTREGKNQETIGLNAFIDKVKKEIGEKK